MKKLAVRSGEEFSKELHFSPDVHPSLGHLFELYGAIENGLKKESIKPETLLELALDSNEMIHEVQSLGVMGNFASDTNFWPDLRFEKTLRAVVPGSQAPADMQLLFKSIPEMTNVKVETLNGGETKYINCDSRPEEGEAIRHLVEAGKSVKVTFPANTSLVVTPGSADKPNARFEVVSNCDKLGIQVKKLYCFDQNNSVLIQTKDDKLFKSREIQIEDE